jgi:hypothetical protein
VEVILRLNRGSSFVQIRRNPFDLF